MYSFTHSIILAFRAKVSAAELVTQHRNWTSFRIPQQIPTEAQRLSLEVGMAVEADSAVGDENVGRSYFVHRTGSFPMTLYLESRKGDWRGVDRPDTGAKWEVH